MTGPPGTTSPLPSPLIDVPSAPVGGGEKPVPPQIQPVGPAVPPGGPAQGVVETTRGIQMVVPESIRPVTEDVLDLLVGPPQP